MLTDEEVDILYGQDLLDCSSSEALINTIWLNNTQLFGLRGCLISYPDLTAGVKI